MSMVDVSRKPSIIREATASGKIRLKPETIQRIQRNQVEKGDVISTAKVSGVMAAKKTSELIPLCHPLPLSDVEITVLVAESTLSIEATVKAVAKTGVEMEALVATCTALLTVWDMTKQYEKDSEGQYPTTIVDNIKIVRKLKIE